MSVPRESVPYVGKLRAMIAHTDHARHHNHGASSASAKLVPACAMLCLLWHL